MDTIVEMLSRAVEQLLGRASGPLHFRLFITPIVVTVLGIRAGLRDAREGRVAFSWLRNSTERRWLLRSALKDIGRVFVIAVVLDTTYQVLVFRYFYILQMLVVAVGCAVVPYVLMRGIVTRLARNKYQKHVFTKQVSHL
jgi:hypothetical protein